MKKKMFPTVGLLWSIIGRKGYAIVISVLFIFSFLASCDNNESLLDVGADPAAQLNRNDSLAIVAIYNKIEPFGEERNLNDRSTWKEVEFSYNKKTHEYRVTGFKSEGVKLVGNFPEEFCELTELRYLEISGGKLKGSIPENIGNLTKLTSLKIKYNSMTGPIPPSIGKLVDLKTLELVNNYISGELPKEMANLKELTHLSISDTRVSGEIPLFLTGFTKLKSLHMFSNYFEGTFPVEVCRIKLNMDFSKNDISVLPDEVWKDPEVKYIPNLQYNRIFHDVPEWVKETELWRKYDYRISDQKDY